MFCTATSFAFDTFFLPNKLEMLFTALIIGKLFEKLDYIHVNFFSVRYVFIFYWHNYGLANYKINPGVYFFKLSGEKLYQGKIMVE